MREGPTQLPPTVDAETIASAIPLDAPAIETLQRLRWLGTRACGGHWHTRVEIDSGRSAGRVWYGYTPWCACPECRRETLRRHRRAVDDHGGVTRGISFTATAPREAGLALDLDRFAAFKAATAKNAQRAVAKVLGIPARSLSVFVIAHPQGSRAGVAHPHVHGVVKSDEGCDLSALDDRRLLAAALADFRERQRRTLTKLAGRPVRLPKCSLRWNATTSAMDRVLDDFLRAIPGWSLQARLSFVGPWRKVKVERERGPALAPAGAIPIETIRRSGWGEILPEERRYTEMVAVTSQSAPAGVEGVTFAQAEWISPGTMELRFTVEDVAAVVYPKVARPVADADSKTIGQLILAREEIRTLGKVPEIVVVEAAALSRDVERRRTPSSDAQAKWLLTALRFEARSRLPDPPPRVCGLLAASEITYIRQVLRDRLKATPVMITDFAIGVTFESDAWTELCKVRKEKKEARRKMRLDEEELVTI